MEYSLLYPAGKLSKITSRSFFNRRYNDSVLSSTTGKKSFISKSSFSSNAELIGSEKVRYLYFIYSTSFEFNGSLSLREICFSMELMNLFCQIDVHDTSEFHL